MLGERIKKALKKAYEKAGTREELEKKTGVSNSAITNLINNKRSTDNMRIATLEKLFPELEVTFFKEERVLTENKIVSAEEGILNDPNLTSNDKRELILRIKEMELNRKLGPSTEHKPSQKRASA